MESVAEQQGPAGSPGDWVDWVLHRLHHEPWALGGLAVIGVFLLGTLSLVVFALLYGCCCSPEDKNQKVVKKKQKTSKSGVI